MQLKYSSKLTTRQKRNIINRYSKGNISMNDLAKLYKVSKTAIWKVINQGNNTISINEVRLELHNVNTIIKDVQKSINKLVHNIDKESLDSYSLDQINKIININATFSSLIESLSEIEMINKSSSILKTINKFPKKNKEV